jgi:hypothetical protein
MLTYQKVEKILVFAGHFFSRLGPTQISPYCGLDVKCP